MQSFNSLTGCELFDTDAAIRESMRRLDALAKSLLGESVIEDNSRLTAFPTLTPFDQDRKSVAALLH